MSSRALIAGNLGGADVSVVWGAEDARGNRFDFTHRTSRHLEGGRLTSNATYPASALNARCCCHHDWLPLPRPPVECGSLADCLPQHLRPLSEAAKQHQVWVF